MKDFFVLVAIILAILFGLEVGLTFLGWALIGTFVLLLVASVYMVVYQVIKGKFISAAGYALMAYVLGWLLNICR